MNLLFTGGSGFLGTNITPFLNEVYDVDTIGLLESDTYRVDLAKASPQLNKSYEVVLHAAGKAHSIPKTNKEKEAFFEVNYQGTVNLCSALEKNVLPRVFVFISTVAVYGCDYGENIDETHALNGTTPYALSKRMAEEYLQSWCEKKQIKLGILRPSLIAGPNAPGNLGAMVSGIKKGLYFNIAGGKARKSVLMVYDIPGLLPLLIEKGGVYNVCDDRHPSVEELSTLIALQLGKRKPMNMPYLLIRLMASLGDCIGDRFPINSLRLKKLMNSLTFSNEKIKRELNWKPIDVLGNYKI